VIRPGKDKEELAMTEPEVAVRDEYELPCVADEAFDANVASVVAANTTGYLEVGAFEAVEDFDESSTGEVVDEGPVFEFPPPSVEALEQQVVSVVASGLFNGIEMGYAPADQRIAS
jgi:hypothetical protein